MAEEPKPIDELEKEVQKKKDELATAEAALKKAKDAATPKTPPTTSGGPRGQRTPR